MKTRNMLRPTGPDIEHEVVTDYELEKEATSCWITVDNISVYVIRTDEGVVVDLYAKGCEMESSLGSTYAFNSEAEEVIDENLATV